MAASVDFGMFKAIIRGGRWRLVSAKDRSIGRQMVDYLNEQVPNESPSIPDRDSWAAQLAVRALGGRIVAIDKPPAFDPEVIY